MNMIDHMKQRYQRENATQQAAAAAEKAARDDVGLQEREQAREAMKAVKRTPPPFGTREPEPVVRWTIRGGADGVRDVAATLDEIPGAWPSRFDPRDVESVRRDFPSAAATFDAVATGAEKKISWGTERDIARLSGEVVDETAEDPTVAPRRQLGELRRQLRMKPSELLAEVESRASQGDRNPPFPELLGSALDRVHEDRRQAASADLSQRRADIEKRMSIPYGVTTSEFQSAFGSSALAELEASDPQTAARMQIAAKIRESVSGRWPTEHGKGPMD